MSMRNNIEETPDHLWHVEIRDSTRRYDDASFDTFEEALDWTRGKGGRYIIVISYRNRSVMIWYDDDKDKRILVENGQEKLYTWSEVERLLTRA